MRVKTYLTSNYKLTKQIFEVHHYEAFLTVHSHSSSKRVASLWFFFSDVFSTWIKIYKTIILPVVVYGCKTWSLTLREESRLRVFKNRILRRIFEPKRDENGEWRRLHNEERLRVGIIGETLWMQHWTSGFHKPWS